MAIARFVPPLHARWLGRRWVAVRSALYLRRRVADFGRDRVVKLAPDGHLLLSWGNRGSGPGEFLGPKGIAIDTTGRLYIADTGNARIQRLMPDGTPEATWPLSAWMSS